MRVACMHRPMTATMQGFLSARAVFTSSASSSRGIDMRSQGMRMHLSTSAPTRAHNRTSSSHLCRNTLDLTGLSVPRYWDWTKDASNFASSPVFDPVYGFGGNGKPAPLPPTSTNPETLGGSGGGCVQTGPFVGSDVVHLAPGATVASASRCLVRNFNENMAKNLLQESNVAPALAATTYFDFNRILNPPDKIAQISVAHTGGHVSVGGDVSGFSHAYP